MSDKEISVIIPCFNLENYIERAISSVLNQNYEKANIEIIVVFDSCTDGSEQIVKKLSEKSNVNILCFKTDVRNAGYARNIGLEHARGKYIYFMDGDDYFINENALAKMQSKMTGETNAVYMESFECEDKKVSEPCAIWRYFYRRTIIGSTRFIPAPINEDLIFVWDIKRKKDYREERIHTALYHYTHPRKGSITFCHEQAKLKL